MNQLLIEPNYRNFVKTSCQFVEDIQIMEILNLDKTKDLLEDLTKLDVIGASINQLGRSVYAFCKKRKEKKRKRLKSKTHISLKSKHLE